MLWQSRWGFGGVFRFPSPPPPRLLRFARKDNMGYARLLRFARKDNMGYAELLRLLLSAEAEASHYK